MTAGTAPAVTYTRVHSMMRAYKETGLLRAGIELGVFDRLTDGPRTAEELATGIGAEPRGTRILLEALAAIGLVVLEDGAFCAATGAERFLSRSGTDFIGDTVRIVAGDEEREAMRRLPEAVRHGGTVLRDNAESPGHRYWEDFATYATAVAAPTAEVVCDGLRTWARESRRLRVLDMACGHGLYGYTFAARFPGSRIWSLDWENVLRISIGHAQRLGVDDRVDLLAGDMFTVPLGGPYDVVMITNVMHHFSRERGQELLQRAADVLRPGGTGGPGRVRHERGAADGRSRTVPLLAPHARLDRRGGGPFRPHLRTHARRGGFRRPDTRSHAEVALPCAHRRTPLTTRAEPNRRQLSWTP